MTTSKRPARRSFGLLAAIVACGAFAVTAADVAKAADSPSAAGPVVMRRINPDQYRQIIANVFGTTVKVGGRFEPDVRQNGLLAVGSSQVSVTSAGLESYDGMARSVADQVVSEQHRATLVPCKPASDTAPDDACATQFIGKVGRLLYRRPLTQEELQTHVGVASAAAKAAKGFYKGLGLSLADLLELPQFLFRVEDVEADPDHAGQYRLDAYSKASQLSFLLWNAGPDTELLAAAASGELNTSRGLAKQVDRMLTSPRVEYGLRAFFIDMFGFDGFENLSKDATIYPKFTPPVLKDAQEQTLRTIVDLVLTQRGDYRDVFTTRKTFLTPLLGSLYGVPVAKTNPNGVPDPWQAYEYPAGDPRSGILAEASFVALHAHPGRSSPTIRGKALREIMLCQKVPDPPGNVDFTVVQETNNPQFKTARERLTAHRTNAVCAGCHKLIDPMGLALENFDGAGSYRTTENGVKIDLSGELDGVAFKDSVGLGQAVHDSPSAASCLVNRLTSYALGRATAKGEAGWVKSLEKDFAAGNYRVPDLLRRVATSDELYHVSAPQTGALDVGGSKLAESNLQQGSGK